MIDWHAFTPWSALIGGVMIGGAAALFILLNGRIAGISGVLGGLLRAGAGDRGWRVAFVAGLMAAPMLIIEILLMAKMYPNRTWNVLLGIGALLFMVACWFGIRQQAAIGDRQFIRSMIPHHAGAILMCEQNRLQDPELKRLCEEIVTSQRAEIAQMKALLDEKR